MKIREFFTKYELKVFNKAEKFSSIRPNRRDGIIKANTEFVDDNTEFCATGFLELAEKANGLLRTNIFNQNMDYFPATKSIHDKVRNISNKGFCPCQINDRAISYSSLKPSYDTFKLIRKYIRDFTTPWRNR